MYAHPGHLPPPNMQSCQAPSHIPAIEGILSRRPEDELPAVLPPLRNIADHTRSRGLTIATVEHERTRQEKLKLERYKIKREMLRDLLQAGVHPNQIPQFFSNIDKLDKSDSQSPTHLEEPFQHTVPQSNPNPAVTSWKQPFPSPTSPSKPVAYRGHHGRTQSYTHTQSALAGLIVETGARKSYPQDHQYAQHMASYPSPALSAATHPPRFSTDIFSASPKALQFKFYKPGPKQKVLRRKKAAAKASPNGIKKEQTGRRDGPARRAPTASASPGKDITSSNQQTSSLRANSSASLAAGSPCEGDELADDAIMSDIDDDSEDDEDETGSELE